MNARKIIGMRVVLGAVAGLVLIGCQKKAAEPAQSNVPTQQQVQEAVTTQQQSATQAANDMIEKARTMVAQAKQYLDQGKFNEAISTAQNVLSFDPNNMDAKKIIEMAKNKLQELATTKANDLKKGLMDKVPGLGQ